MSIVDDVQQALDAYRSGGIGAADLAQTLLLAAHQLTASPVAGARAQASAECDLIDTDDTEPSITNHDDMLRRPQSGDLTDDERQQRSADRAAARARNAAMRDQTRAEMIQLLGGDRPEQSRSSLCASVTHRRGASRILTEMLLDGTLVVVAPDVCALANNPQYQPKPRPHPDDNRIAAWLTDNEGVSPHDDETIQIIRVRLWGSTVPPSPIPQGSGNGSNKRRKTQKTKGAFMRYIGSKYRAQDQIKTHMPEIVDEYREPFMGSATTALAMATWHPDATIWINDANPNVFHLWSQLQSNSDELIQKLLDARRSVTSEDAARAYWHECAKKLRSGTISNVETAVCYYAVNRLSYCCLAEIGRFAKSSNATHWREDKIIALTEYTDLIKNWRITNLDYRDVIHAPTAGENPFIFADPPYDVPDRLYYGHAEFNHDNFAAEMSKISTPTLITYNHSEANLRRFEGWSASSMRLTYTAAGAKKKKVDEYIFRNYKA